MLLAERDPTMRMVLWVLIEHRRALEVHDLKHLAVWTANAVNGKAP